MVDSNKMTNEGGTGTTAAVGNASGMWWNAPAGSERASALLHLDKGVLVESAQTRERVVARETLA